jgi:hypothetical protein
MENTCSPVDTTQKAALLLSDGMSRDGQAHMRKPSRELDWFAA